MQYETDIPPPEAKPQISEIIRNLPVNQSVRIPEDAAHPGSVRSLVSRVRAEFNGERAFVTAKEGDGLRVWRTA